MRYANVCEVHATQTQSNATQGKARNRTGGRLLDDLLVAALERAVAREHGDGLRVAVGEHLHLDVPHALRVPHHEHRRARRLRLHLHARAHEHEHLSSHFTALLHTRIVPRSATPTPQAKG